MLGWFSTVMDALRLSDVTQIFLGLRHGSWRRTRGPMTGQAERGSEMVFLTGSEWLLPCGVVKNAA